MMDYSFVSKLLSGDFARYIEVISWGWRIWLFNAIILRNHAGVLLVPCYKLLSKFRVPCGFFKYREGHRRLREAGPVL